MTTVIQTQPVPETATGYQLDPGRDTDHRTIADHLGPAFRITPIGSRRFRCNKYARATSLYPTGRLAETLLLRVTSTSIEHLSDREARSDRARPW
jgi:hypothetical protein